jgi:hypothetical protein
LDRIGSGRRIEICIAPDAFIKLPKTLPSHNTFSKDQFSQNAEALLNNFSGRQLTLPPLLSRFFGQ